ncbi:alpha/beta hydrolase [Longispora sp. K20-0274]|uniref:alpha/beta hydrolase n=1 Tax=Longispora sp. K20-0274 TaxID=3088255 RepID=UPI00399A028C
MHRTANISYGDAGRRNLLDVYRHRSRPTGAPVLIHLHGGGYRRGRKNSQALPVLYRLASQGWVCVSANYRLRPHARHPEHLIDYKLVIAPGTRTRPRARGRPVDTSVTAAISLNGYHGPYYGQGRNSSPVAHVRPDAPPFLIVHGDHDTVVPVGDARHFADALRTTSNNPVVYAELAGAQHAFDLFSTIRFETVIDTIEAFAAWVRTRSGR